MQSGALRVAMAEAEDLGLRSGDGPHRIAGRRRAVGRDADDLAVAAREVLRESALAVQQALAHRDEQRARPVEHEPRAEMRRRSNLGLLAVDHGHGRKAEGGDVQHRACNRRAVDRRVGRVAFRVAEVDAPVGRERGIQCDIEQATLPFGQHSRHAADVAFDAAAGGQQLERARPLGDEHPAVGQEGEAPRVGQAGGHLAHADGRRRSGTDGRDGRRRCRSGGRVERGRRAAATATATAACLQGDKQADEKDAHGKRIGPNAPAFVSIRSRSGPPCSSRRRDTLGGLPGASIETIFVITEAPRHHACAALPTLPSSVIRMVWR